MKNEYILEVSDFSLKDTMECGQCFNYEAISENEYIITAFGKLLHVVQENNKLIFKNDIIFDRERAANNCSFLEYKDKKEYEEEIKNTWLPYFDLDRDYNEIKKRIVEIDSKMSEAVASGKGIRILRQEYYEMVISFIISQRQSIPNIRSIIKGISKKYGDYLGSYDNKDYYSFPDIEILKNISEEEYRECKCGYRAPYLVEASNWLWQCYNENKEEHESMKALSYAQAKERLLAVKGIGEKVADCILLFGLGFTDAFPVDVWIDRAMKEMYSEEMNAFWKKEGKNINISNAKPGDIRRFGESKFGKYSGFAQQFIFDYARNSK